MEYFIHLAIIFTIYAMLALSLNLVVGFTGLLSVTQAAFYGIGAYSTAILLAHYNGNFFISLLLGAIITTLVSLLVGYVLSRFKGDYFALGSFGFNVILYSIFLNWQEVTRGPLGIPGVSRPELFGINLSDNFAFLLLIIVFLLATYGICSWITNSSFGRVLKAIREDETAIQVFGYNTLNYKLTVFMVAAVLASVAGSFFASYISFIDPSTFTLTESIFILSIIILGGLASLRGALVGALFLVLLPEILRFVGFPTDIAAQMRQVIYGLILILLMLYRPQGLYGEYKL